MAIQREFERKLGLTTFTPEYEVVSFLLDDEWLTPSQLQSRVRASPAALRYMLASMRTDGIVEERQNPVDSRSTQYRLADPMRTLVLNQYEGYLGLALNVAIKKRIAKVPLNHYRSFIHKTQQVSHLTAEFQILLYLYVAPGLENHSISMFIDVSLAKFNQSLRKLRALSLVEVSSNPADRRSKLYDLANPVRGQLDKLHDQVAQWLASKRITESSRGKTSS